MPNRTVSVLILDPESETLEQQYCKGRGRKALLQLIQGLNADDTSQGEEDDFETVAERHFHQMRTALLTDFSPYQGAVDSAGARRLTDFLVNELQVEQQQSYAGVTEAIVVILIQSGVREATTGDDVVFHPKMLKPPQLRLKTLLNSSVTAMNRIFDKKEMKLQFLCVIDPTLSDQLLPVPKPAIASRIQSVLDTLPEQQGQFSINYSMFLPTCSVEFKDKMKGMLTTVEAEAARRGLQESASSFSDISEFHDHGPSQTDNPFSDQLQHFLEIFTVILQMVFEMRRNADAPHLLSSDLVTICNQFLILMWAQSRRTLTTVVPDPMELCFLTKRPSRGDQQEVTTTNTNLVDDVFGFDLKTRNWLQSGYAFFPSARTILRGMFFGNPFLMLVWNMMNNMADSPMKPTRVTKVEAATNNDAERPSKEAAPIIIEASISNAIERTVHEDRPVGNLRPLPAAEATPAADEPLQTLQKIVPLPIYADGIITLSTRQQNHNPCSMPKPGKATEMCNHNASEQVQPTGHVHTPPGSGESNPNSALEAIQVGIDGERFVAGLTTEAVTDEEERTPTPPTSFISLNRRAERDLPGTPASGVVVSARPLPANGMLTEVGVAASLADRADSQAATTAQTNSVVREGRDFSNALYGVIYIGQHPSPHTDGSGRRHCLTCGKELTAQESWADHVAMTSHLEKAGEYKPVPDVDGRVPQPHYLCIICHSVISGDKNRSLHVEGLRHKRRKELSQSSLSNLNRNENVPLNGDACSPDEPAVVALGPPTRPGSPQLPIPRARRRRGLSQPSADGRTRHFFLFENRQRGRGVGPFPPPPPRRRRRASSYPEADGHTGNFSLPFGRLRSGEEG